MGLLTALPLGDNSNTTMYILAGVAVVCVVAIAVLWLGPKFSKKEEQEEQNHVEEINEE